MFVDLLEGLSNTQHSSSFKHVPYTTNPKIVKKDILDHLINTFNVSHGCAWFKVSVPIQRKTKNTENEEVSENTILAKVLPKPISASAEVSFMNNYFRAVCTATREPNIKTNTRGGRTAFILLEFNTTY